MCAPLTKGIIWVTTPVMFSEWSLRCATAACSKPCRYYRRWFDLLLREMDVEIYTTQDQGHCNHVRNLSQDKTNSKMAAMHCLTQFIIRDCVLCIQVSSGALMHHYCDCDVAPCYPNVPAPIKRVPVLIKR